MYCIVKLSVYGLTYYVGSVYGPLFRLKSSAPSTYGMFSRPLCYFLANASKVCFKPVAFLCHVCYEIPLLIYRRSINKGRFKEVGDYH